MEPSTAVPFLRNAEHLKEWKPQSWRSLPALQQPSYPDKVLPPFVIPQFGRVGPFQSSIIAMLNINLI